ncbi:hypothetical protein KR018_012227 [Drosophila ironensis]|nr:hypothetical protein KR018_012227 [Drosophila ironensis]
MCMYVHVFAEMSSLEFLSDDCILKILEYLAFEDQFKLWHIDPKSRLALVIASQWQRHGYIQVSRKIFENIPESVYNYYLECFSPFARHIFLSELPANLLQQLGEHRFPKVQHLEYQGWHRAAREIFRKCFPTLESLSLWEKGQELKITHWTGLQRLGIRLNISRATFSEICHHIPHLRHLGVRIYPPWQNGFFAAIEGLTKLESLEAHIPEISEENIIRLMTLPNLRKLRICNLFKRSAVLTEIGRLCGRQVVAISLVETSPPLYEHTPFRSNDQIWNMLKPFTQLKHLRISHMDLEEAFFAFNKAQMREILQQRNEPLMLHFYKTGRESEILQHFKHPKIEVSFKPFELKSSFPWNSEFSFIEIDFA